MAAINVAKKAMFTNVNVTSRRLASNTAKTTARPQRKRKVIDETTLGGAQHKVSLSGPSLGHLISELSATRPGMEHVRGPGRDLAEDQRTMIRNVVKAIVVVPSLIGAAIVGWNWYSSKEQDH
ncbi:hypothetical protein CKM354_000186200 [Cercospora kikuchii]|uniref:Uncharacterized protein n=1 Tax=Cercospora kikuchii TaxID=84275 RepID=A0A9P3FDD2_9PEZI|nr:uncharacterized protein CKM354_000186200 [Cercospora kikuchii]GIZ38445.1 hypothetical protein CKM354_000186200 [Cercospora kikuchii]